LEGLEVKELLFTELSVDNEKFRIDDQFFLKKYLRAYSKIKSVDSVQLFEIINVLTDFSANGSYENIAKNFELLDSLDYAYMVRSTDLEKKDYTTNVKYVNKHTYDFLSKSKIFGGELLINKIGSPGRVYIMPILNIPVSLGMNLFMIKLKPETHFKEKFIWTFFNSEFGQNIIQRKVNGTVPLTIDKEAVKSLYIPNLSADFQVAIDNMINDSEEKLKSSKDTYILAENYLLNKLELNDFQPSNETVNIKSFAESYSSTGRLDAEYYQSRYEELLNYIRSIKYDKLGHLVNIRKSIEPGSEAYQEEGIPFIRVSNLTKYGIADTDIHLDKSEYANVLRPKKDTILLSKDGTVGIAYKVPEDMFAITSGAILHLNVQSDEVLPDYLTLVLNSFVVQMQAERDAGGSILQHWKPSEIEQVEIPIVDKDIQIQISELIQESFRLKKESEYLLELAKRAVEVAIEEGEERALDVINGSGLLVN